MEHRIFPSEFATLLLVFWGPSFILAAVIQWRLLAKSRSGHCITGRRLLGALFAAALAQGVLAMAIWLSPLHRMMLPSLDFLGPTISIGSLPFQTGLAAAIMVTGVVAALRDRLVRVSESASPAM